MENRGLVVAVVVILVVLLLGGAGMMGFGMMGGYGMMGGGPGSFGVMSLIGGVMMLLFWGVVIGGIVWLVLALSRSGAQSPLAPPRQESPLDILKARYARGEITKEQFDSMRRDLDT